MKTHIAIVSKLLQKDNKYEEDIFCHMLDKFGIRTSFVFIDPEDSEVVSINRIKKFLDDEQNISVLIGDKILFGIKDIYRIIVTDDTSASTEDFMNKLSEINIMQDINTLFTIIVNENYKFNIANMFKFKNLYVADNKDEMLSYLTKVITYINKLLK